MQISEGAIANMLVRASSALATEASRIAEIVCTSPVIASDETSARVCGKNHWQWTFLCASAVYHTIQPSRGKAVPVAFLGQAKPDVWVSDRLAAQGNHAAAHQYCLAHLMRDAQYAIDAGDRIFPPAFKRFLQDACAVGAKHVAVARRIGPRAMQRAVGDERLEDAGHLQELDEERGLPERRLRRLRVPFDLDPARPAVDGDGRRRHLLRNWRLPTRRVSRNLALVLGHPPDKAHLPASRNKDRGKAD